MPQIISDLAGTLQPSLRIASVRIKDESGIASARNKADSDYVGFKAKAVESVGGVKMGLAASAAAGTIQWNGSNFQGHDGSTWKDLDKQGTVTSVQLTVPSGILAVSSSPVTSAGTLDLYWIHQNANKILAGPTSGSAYYPSFRSLVAADIPSLDWSKITTGKPTTLAGYGITDAVAIGSSLSSAALTMSTARLLGRSTAGTGVIEQITIGAGLSLSGGVLSTTGGGSVVSVGLALPAEFSVTGSPITGAGTLTGAWVSQGANSVFAGPNGSSGTPSFRSLVSADIPNLDWSKITTGKPTTLAGYGITNGATNGLITGSGLTLVTNRLLGRSSVGTGAVEEISIGSGLSLSGGVLSNTAIGTVSSVGLALPAEFAISGSPVTSTGTLTAAWNAQAKNTFLAGPTLGVNATPTFRTIQQADLPTGTVTGSGSSSGAVAFWSTTSSLTGNNNFSYNIGTFQLSISSGGDSTSTTTGTLKVSGGVGITQSVFVGGTLNVTRGTITTALNSFNNTVTWNAGAITFTNILSNVTDTASNAASLLMDLQKGGVSQFKVGKSGDVTQTGAHNINRGTLTALSPSINVTATWNNAAVTFTSLLYNITDTASNAASLLMDLQKGGVSQFKVGKSGDVYIAGKLTVVGLIDPTGLQLSRQSSNPGTVDTYWVDNTGAPRFGASTLSTGATGVTSVGLALPAEFTVSGSPVTSTGTLTGAWAAAAANSVFAGPNGSSGTPSFRSLVAADLPASVVLTSGSYADPTWITSLAGSKLTGAYTAAGLTMATSRLLGRTTASAGAAEEISVGTGLSLSAGVLSCTVTPNPGTVTSVGLVLPGELSVTVTPITTSGNLTAAWSLQSANKVFAGPSSGGSAAPSFRTLVAADLPTIVSVALPAYQIAYGDPSNLMTSSSLFTFNNGILTLTGTANLSGVEAGGPYGFVQPLTLTADATGTLADQLTGVTIFIKSDHSMTGDYLGININDQSAPGIVNTAIGLQINDIVAGSNLNRAISTGAGQVYFADTTASTSTVTGALVVGGGAGIGGNLWIGGSLNLPSKTANYVFAAPNGSAGAPSFRALVAADIPALSYIGGSIANTQVAVGSGTNTIAGSTGLTFSSGILSIAQNQTIAPLSGTVLQVVGTNNVKTRIEAVAFGSSAYATFTGRTARGNPVTPQNSQADDIIIAVSACGYGDGWPTTNRGLIHINAAENWSSTNQGTYISFDTTASGGVSTSEKVRIYDNGGVQIGGTFGTSPGANKLSLAGLVIRDGGTYTTTIQAGTQAANLTLTLPAAHGAGMLRNNGTGTLSWDTTSYAVDSSVVHIGGPETITGAKTFTSPLFVNVSGGTLPATPTDTVGWFVNGGTGISSRVVIGTYNGGTPAGHSVLVGRTARGTIAAPSAIQAGDEVLSMEGFGYGATGFSSAARAEVSFFAAENWTDSAQGMRIGLWTTATGGTSTTEKVRIWGDGGVTISTSFSASPGASCLAIAGTVASTNTTSGALTVSGGAGIAGTVNANVLAAADGLVSAPGHTFTSELTSGLFRQAANTVSLALGGVEYARFNVASGFIQPTILNINAPAIGTDITLVGVDTAPFRAFSTISTNGNSASVYGRAVTTSNAPVASGIYGYATNTSGDGTVVGVTGNSAWSTAGGSGVSRAIGGRFISTSASTTAGKTSYGVLTTVTATGATNAASLVGVDITATGAASSASVFGTNVSVTVPAAFTGTTVEGISASVVMSSGTASTTATSVRALDLALTVNQGGALGYTGMLLNVTETATGSGAKNLLDLQVGGGSRFSVANTGVLSLSPINGSWPAISISVNDGGTPTGDVNWVTILGSATPGSGNNRGILTAFQARQSSTTYTIGREGFRTGPAWTTPTLDSVFVVQTLSAGSIADRFTITGAGITNVLATTASTSSTTGALIVAGGVGVAGQLNVAGTNSTFSANWSSNSPTVGVVTITNTNSGTNNNPTLSLVSNGDYRALVVNANSISSSAAFTVIGPISTNQNSGKAFQFNVTGENFGRGQFYMNGAYGCGIGTAARDTYLIRVDNTENGGVATWGIANFAGNTGNWLMNDGSTAAANLWVKGTIKTDTFYVSGTQSVSASATINCGRVRFTGSTAGQTLTLPTGISGTDIWVRNSSSVSVTVAAAGADTIEGAANIVIPAGNAYRFTFIGGDWTTF